MQELVEGEEVNYGKMLQVRGCIEGGIDTQEFGARDSSQRSLVGILS